MAYLTADDASDDMRFFFDDCINQVIELIQSQITQVEKKKSRIKVRRPESRMNRFMTINLVNSLKWWIQRVPVPSGRASYFFEDAKCTAP